MKVAVDVVVVFIGGGKSVKSRIVSLPNRWCGYSVPAPFRVVCPTRIRTQHACKGGFADFYHMFFFFISLIFKINNYKKNILHISYFKLIKIIPILHPLIISVRSLWESNKEDQESLPFGYLPYEARSPLFFFFFFLFKRIIY